MLFVPIRDGHHVQSHALLVDVDLKVHPMPPSEEHVRSFESIASKTFFSVVDVRVIPAFGISREICTHFSQQLKLGTVHGYTLRKEGRDLVAVNTFALAFPAGVETVGYVAPMCFFFRLIVGLL